MVANEVFIDSATLRENVVSLAKNIGYMPRSRKAARATISFFIDTTSIVPTPANITLKKGIVATSQGSFGTQAFTYCILEDITVPFTIILQHLTRYVYEGSLLSANFTYSARNPNQKFVLNNVVLMVS